MKDFTKDEIMEMKEDFIAILRRVKRPGANIEDLINKLETTDFFTAPASTKFHNACYGGLLAHSLNVYNNLKMLVSMKGLEEEISEDSIIICGLLHDMSKIGYYERTVRNKKVYSPDGSKYDEMGRFDWVAEPSWGVITNSKRFIYGSHEENSEFMIRCYISLKLDESVAVLNHHAGVGKESIAQSCSYIFHKYPLANLLHVADMIATFTDEESNE